MSREPRGGRPRAVPRSLAAALALAVVLVAGAVSAAGVAGAVSAAGVAGAVSAAGPDAAGASAASARARPAAAKRDTADFRASLLRTAIAAAGLAVYALGARGARGPQRARLRRAALVALALAAYGSYYQFFRLGHPEGFATPDNFHYYVGSKYFRELGYFGLYECSLRALEERGVRLPAGREPRVRELRTMQLRPAEQVREQGRDCRARFSPERWRAFSSDVGWFVEKWPPHIRNAVWEDHGYHPSPVWTLVGAAVAGAAPTGSATAVRVLARTDRVLIAAALVGVGLAFGLEAGCLAAIVWGTGQLWRYTWVGDAYLRHLWWIATLAGLCALRRGAPALGGAGLACAALLRLFPAAFTLGWGAGALRAWRSGALERGHVPRFALGAGATALVLLVLALASIGQGLAPLADFAAKIGEFASVAATNKVGLGVLAERLASGAGALALRAAVAVGFLALFWRGLRDALPFEAAASGATLIPFLSDPTNYYYSFFACCAVLAVRRPPIGTVLLATALAWNVNGLVLYRSYAEFPAASAIALVGAAAIAAAMSRPAARPLAAPGSPA